MSKPTIPEVIDRFRAYHDIHCEWGALHVVLADGNVHDDFVKSSIVRAEEDGDAEGAELARTLLLMSRTQRKKIPRLCQ